MAPARAAQAAGVPRLVVVGASIPPFVPGMSFGVSRAKGVFSAGYAVAGPRFGGQNTGCRAQGLRFRA